MPRAEKKVARFVPGLQGQTYRCGACGKRTRETGAGESGFDLCAACLQRSYRDNYHYDHGHAGNPGCAACKAGGF